MLIAPFSLHFFAAVSFPFCCCGSLCVYGATVCFVTWNSSYVCNPRYGNLYTTSNRERTLAKSKAEHLITTMISRQVINSNSSSSSSTRTYIQIHVDSMRVGRVNDSSTDIDIGVAPVDYEFSACWLRYLNPSTYLTQVCCLCCCCCC